MKHPSPIFLRALFCALLCALLCLPIPAAETVPSDGTAGSDGTTASDGSSGTSNSGNTGDTGDSGSSDDSGGSSGTPGTVRLSDSAIELGINTTTRLNATPSTEDGVVEWSIEDTSIIRFSSSSTTVTGPEVNVYGVAPGRATVTAHLKAGGPESKCTVTVSGIVLSETELSMPVSSFENLGYQVYGAAGRVTNWTWTTSNTSVVRFTEQADGVTLQAMAEGTATISVNGGGYSAVPCRVTVVPNDASTLKATLTNGVLRFSTIVNGIRTRCRQLTGEELSYITSLSVSTERGILYDGYVSEGDTGHGVATAQRYSYDTGAYRIENITFVPKSTSTGEVSITYNGYSVGGKTFTGNILVSITSSPATLAYASQKGEPIKFRGEDFAKYSMDLTNRTLQYVNFTLPPASTGVLYYNYQSSLIYESVVKAATRYYRSTTPSLDNVTFVPTAGYNGSFSLNFTGSDMEGKTFEGIARITVTNNDSTGTSGSTSTGVTGDIAYTVQRGHSVSFRTADFNELCLSRQGNALNSIQFTTLPAEARGILYYGRDTEVRTSSRYYRTGDSRRIADLSFTAGSSYTGTFTIPFTAYDTEDGSFDGTIAMTVTATGSGSSSSDTAEYQTTGPAVALRGADLVAQAGSVLDNVASIRLYDPPATTGRLVLQYISPGVYTKFDSSKSYEPSELNRVYFLPKAGFEGTAALTFVARDSMGTVYSSVFHISVKPPTESTYFRDLSGRSWAVPAVDFFRYYNVLNGTTPTTYSPDGAARRGQFIAVLGRMFDFPTVYTAPWLIDVPQNMYYAPYFAAAVNFGIVTPTWDERVYPDAPITREDAALYLYRCLKRAGMALEGDESDLRVFSDWGQIDLYAREAMASMVRMGVFQGDDNRRLHPYGALTRLQMAAILHRAMT